MFKNIIILLKLLILIKDKKFYFLILKITGVLPAYHHYYKLAFKHKSLMLKDKNGLPLNNERLEFLGDAILGAVIAGELYKRYPNKKEGALTRIRARLVNRINLNELAVKMGLHKLIEAQTHSNPKQTHIPGDALEALIGAIFLDKGYKAASKFITKKIIDKFPNLNEADAKDSNYKSILIEWGQKNKNEIHFITEEYPSQKDKCDPEFYARAFMNNELIGRGKGATKKEAQQNAACEALKNASSLRSISLN
ncbi:ribonuclease III [Marinilabiliaceae bacterium ANBcel2]|nr:ribonuclease III [Marinilabiliaceae bacterium ANBcel2]